MFLTPFTQHDAIPYSPIAIGQGRFFSLPAAPGVGSSCCVLPLRTRVHKNGRQTHSDAQVIILPCAITPA